MSVAADDTWWDVDPSTLPVLPEWAYEARPPTSLEQAHPGWVYLIEREKAQRDWTTWLAAPSRGSELYHSGVLDGYLLGLEHARLRPEPDHIGSDDGMSPPKPRQKPAIPGIRTRS